MPPPVDLTGRRFGKITVLRREGSRAWRVKCDCSREEVVKKHRIPSTPSAAARRDACYSCSECARRRQCNHCGTEFRADPPTSRYCSKLCKAAATREQSLAYYHRQAEDEDFREVRRARTRERWASATPTTKARIAKVKALFRERHSNRIKEYASAHYAANADEILKRRRERRAAMSLEEASELEEAAAHRSREYYERWRNSPEFLARRSEAQKRFKRRRAEATAMKDLAALRSAKNEQSDN